MVEGTVVEGTVVEHTVVEQIVVERISAGQARRIALAAQGFGSRMTAAPDIRHRELDLIRTIDRLALVQLDSVNVFERSHYLPLFSRLGGYDRAAFDRLVFAPPSPGAGSGRYVEYWAHQAAIIPVESWPLFRWRMAELRERYGGQEGGWVASNGKLLDWLRAELAHTGPVRANKIEHDATVSRGGWWGWSEVKTGLEYLFLFGEVTTAGRTRFERQYGLAEQLLPRQILDAEMPREDAIRSLLRVAAKAHGLGTLSDFADYFRLKQAPAAAALNELVDSGELVPVAVEGWSAPAYLHRDASRPRRIDATALLSPFDPVVWFRPRAERLFDFHYRIEIYTPAAKRVFGYYSLPILLDDRLVGRVDLKSDRQNRVLRVQSAWSEPDAPSETAPRVAELLRSAAQWQGLDGVAVVDRGTLARAIAGELGVAAGSAP